MTVKDYKHFTKAERDQSQKTWVEVLNTYCVAYDDGCRPCDYGCPCDKCHYDYELQKKYAKLLVERDIPLTPREAVYLADE